MSGGDELQLKDVSLGGFTRRSRAGREKTRSGFVSSTAALLKVVSTASTRHAGVSLVRSIKTNKTRASDPLGPFGYIPHVNV